MFVRLVYGFLLSGALTACAATEFSSEAAKPRTKSKERSAPRGAQGPDDEGDASDASGSTAAGDPAQGDDTGDGADSEQPSRAGEDDGQTEGGGDTGEETDHAEGGDDLQEDDEVVKNPKLDYGSCATLPSAGKRPYGRCNAEEAVVIVNDGETPHMTCCPLTGGKLLADDPAKQFQVRVGTCLDGEILTGMIDPKTPSLFCSTLAPGLEIKALKPSVYTTGANAADAAMSAIVGSYNGNDTCVCPAGTLAVGGHTKKDNVCAEQCAEWGPK